jgi:plasmid stability protein
MGRWPEGPEGSEAERSKSLPTAHDPSAAYDAAPPHLNGEEGLCRPFRRESQHPGTPKTLSRLNLGRIVPESPPPPDINDIIDIKTSSAYVFRTMATLLIRGLDDRLKQQLRIRAAENGRSMEEEVRRILRHALGVPSPEEEHDRKLEEIEAAARARFRSGGG